MERLKRQQYFFDSFNKFNKKQQREILKNLDLDQLKALVEICFNILNGFPLIPEEDLKKFKKTHISKIRKIGSPKVSLKRKKKVLIKGSGVITAIIGSLAGVAIDSIIKKYLEKNQNESSREGKD